MRPLFFAALSLTFVSAFAIAGPCTPGPGIWNEGDLGQGDAGKKPNTANVTTGVGPLSTVCGNLGNVSNGADMYEIMITGTTFSALTHQRGGSTLNPALYLFDVSGSGLYANNDISGVNNQAQFVNVAVTPGLYFLAIASDNNEPQNPANKNLFGEISGTTGLILVDSKLKNQSIGGWTDAGNSSGAYYITLDGATFAQTPEPAAFGLFGAGLLALAYRRFRR
jgi:hypothetical protein